jgi:hypothetical protein
MPTVMTPINFPASHLQMPKIRDLNGVLVNVNDAQPTLTATRIGLSVGSPGLMFDASPRGAPTFKGNVFEGDDSKVHFVASDSGKVSPAQFAGNASHTIQSNADRQLSLSFEAQLAEFGELTTPVLESLHEGEYDQDPTIPDNSTGTLPADSISFASDSIDRSDTLSHGENANRAGPDPNPPDLAIEPEDPPSDDEPLLDSPSSRSDTLQMRAKNDEFRRPPRPASGS